MQVGCIATTTIAAGTTLLVPHVSTADTYTQRDISIVGDASGSLGMRWEFDEGGIAGDAKWSDITEYEYLTTEMTQ